VYEIALRDFFMLSSVQTVLRMILRILPPVFVIRFFTISDVIRGRLSECLGIITFVEFRL